MLSIKQIADGLDNICASGKADSDALNYYVSVLRKRAAQPEIERGDLKKAYNQCDCSRQSHCTEADKFCFTQGYNAALKNGRITSECN